ncbi:hypothetical protein F5Y16DRAFT_419883 [Xylariaceae sp. FL0255]|nr:hypothetical protein F5Y16DRAFT_419883 [Xylariaceae sp. FL0255]
MTSPMDPQVGIYSHANGHPTELLDRLAISELCKGWPVYRDASEWKNFRSLFCEDAYVWTTWSKRQTIDSFIRVSKEGKARGDFIMHRECGTVVDLNPSTCRAVGKMKATITQRFTIPGDPDRGVEPVVFDVDCDCRFHFFCLDGSVEMNQTHQGDGHGNGSGAGTRHYSSGSPQWKVRYVKLIYDKDKVVPVDGKAVPTFSENMLRRCPEGYRYLGAAQRMLGHDVDEFLPTIQGPEKGAAHRLWLDMYEKMGQWLEGKDDVDLSSPGSPRLLAIDSGHGKGNGNGAHHGGAMKVSSYGNGHGNGAENGNGYHFEVTYD